MQQQNNDNNKHKLILTIILLRVDQTYLIKNAIKIQKISNKMLPAAPTKSFSYRVQTESAEPTETN